MSSRRSNLPWVGLGVIVFLVLSTQFPPSGDIVQDAQQYFSAEEIEQGRTFAMQRRWIFWANALAQLVWLVYLVFTPIGKRIYLATGSIVHGHWLTHLILMAGAYFLGSALIAFPFRVALYFLNASWGMTSQPLFDWLGDYGLALIVAAIVDGVVIVGFYTLVRVLPGIWWLVAGVASVAFGLIAAFLVPNVVDPLFNTFTPFSQTEWAKKPEWKDLDSRIRSMGQRLGINVSNIYVSDASRQTHAGNAYFTGLGGSQRIVLYDNLLNKHSPEEVETVVAHEMGHWYQRHIIQGILIGGVAITIGLFFLYRYLNALVEIGALRGAGDVAGLFRVILIAELALAVTLPIQRGVSRVMEGQADHAALELSKKPRAFIDAEIRLARFNKMDVVPSRWNTLLFASHPPVVRRIQMAEQWERQKASK